MTVYFTGVGSRKTPQNILQLMCDYGSLFARMDWVLRSGAAPGADTAFETGCFSARGRKEIYLPWKGFQNHTSSLYNIPAEAMEIAADIYGPSWKYLKRTIRLLMARDILQVTGQTLDVHSHFVVCWTPDGCSSRAERTRKTGGTGQAVAYASSLDIPVFNLQREDTVDRLCDFLADKIKVSND